MQIEMSNLTLMHVILYEVHVHADKYKLDSLKSNPEVVFFSFFTKANFFKSIIKDCRK